MKTFWMIFVGLCAMAIGTVSTFGIEAVGIVLGVAVVAVISALLSISSIYVTDRKLGKPALVVISLVSALFVLVPTIMFDTVIHVVYFYIFWLLFIASHFISEGIEAKTQGKKEK